MLSFLSCGACGAKHKHVAAQEVAGGLLVQAIPAGSFGKAHYDPLPLETPLIGWVPIQQIYNGRPSACPQRGQHVGSHNPADKVS